MPVDLSFGETFAFTRGRAASYRNAAGERVAAAMDTPRFDHHRDGTPRGLLVEGRPATRHADRCVALDGEWSTANVRTTVLHEYETPTGGLRRRAWYADAAGPLAVIEACLNIKGWHRSLAVVPGHLVNRDGEVRWRDRFYQLGGLINAAPGVLLAADSENHLLIEG